MAIKKFIFRTVAAVLIERPARKRTTADLAGRLETSGRQIGERLATGKDDAPNRRQIRHIIGIERWGQRRLQTFLGEPLPRDEYDGYQPESTLAWPQLCAEFEATRQQTLHLIRRLEEAASGRSTVPHNDFGDLSLKGWLRYLDFHANQESKRIK